MVKNKYLLKIRGRGAQKAGYVMLSEATLAPERSAGEHLPINEETLRFTPAKIRRDFVRVTDFFWDIPISPKLLRWTTNH